MMSKTRRRHSQQARKTQPRWFVPAAIAGAVVLVGAFLLWLFNQQPTTISSEGAPRVEVDQTSLDFGDVRFEMPVEGVFRVSNVGTKPLTIVGEPIVELIEGC
jgi:hypothetical protein